MQEKRIAGMAYGPNIPHPWLAVYHEEGQVFALVKVTNNGNTAAYSIGIAARVEFRRNDPKWPNDYQLTDFNDTVPNSLQGKSREQAVSTIILGNRIPASREGQLIYIWGVIRFQNELGVESKKYFCGYPTSTDAAIKAAPGRTGGYGTPNIHFCEKGNQ